MSTENTIPEQPVSDTPRTDTYETPTSEAITSMRRSQTEWMTAVPADFARTLERELAAAQRENAELRERNTFYVERSVGAMAIAEGDEGHEAIPRDCPMLQAVSDLRLNRDQMASSLQRQTEYAISAKTGESKALARAEAAEAKLRQASL